MTGIDQTTERVEYGDGYAVTGVADDPGETIVAEVSKTWDGNLDERPGTISQYFEHVIRTNKRRGYELRDWKFAATPMQGYTGGVRHAVDGPVVNAVETVAITETIVAVFERVQAVPE